MATREIASPVSTSYNRHPTDRTAVSEDPDLATIASLIDNEHARTVLTAASDEPMSATELTACTEATLPTMYRILDRLQDADLVEEGTRIRPDGHHDTVYVATLDAIEFSLEDGSLELSVSRRRGDPAAELASLWERF